MSGFRRKVRNALTAFIVASVCISCQNSSSSSSGSSDNKKTISGVVSDPEIKDAKVNLYRDGVIQPFFDVDNRNTNQAVTDGNGVFKLKISSSKDISRWVVKSTGGFDTVTGENLDGVEFSASMELFDDPDKPVVSPLTSLATDEMEGGLEKNNAIKKVNAYLGLPEGTDLAVNPTSENTLLEKSILVTKLVKQLKKNGKNFPVRVLRDALTKNNLINGDQINGALLDEVITDSDQRDDLQEDYTALKEQLKSPGDFGKKSYMRTLFKVVRKFYMDQNNVKRAAFKTDSDKSALETSFKMIANKIATAMSEKVDDGKQEKAVIYLLQLTSVKDKASFLAVDLSNTLDEKLALEETKKQLAAIASFSSTVKYLVSIPLTPEQLLGNDNKKRAEYYYNSNVANTYFEKKVLENVFDDKVTDPVYNNLACTWAEAGDFDRANKYLDEKIYQNDEKMKAYECVGEAYGRHNRHAEGVRLIQKSEALFKKRIQAIGMENVTKDDLTEALRITKKYYQLSDMERAESLLDYSSENIVNNLGGAWAAGTAASSYRKVVDTFLEDGETPKSAINAVLAKAVELIRNAASHPTTGYRMHYMYLAWFMQQYGRNGNEAAVMDILGNDGDIGKKTLKGLVGGNHVAADKASIFYYRATEALAMVGRINEATKLANSASKQAYKTKALTPIYTWEGVYGDLDPAWDKFYASTDDKQSLVTRLTFNYANRNLPYFGALLVDRGQTEKAKAFLVKAMTLLNDHVASAAEKNQASYNTIAKSGYRNIGILYLELGMQTEAISAFEKSENLYKTKMMAPKAGEPGYPTAKKIKNLNNMDDYRFAIDGLLELARLYRPFDIPKSNQLVDDANSFFDKPEFKSEYNVGDRTRIALDYTTTWKSREYFGVIYKKQFQCDVFDSYLTYGFKEKAEEVLEKAYAAADAISLNDRVDYDGKTGVDNNKLDKVKGYIRVADAYSRLRNSAKADEALQKALPIVAKMKLPTTRIEQLGKVAASYAKASLYDKAVDVANSIETTGNRNKAFESIAEAYKDFNAFPRTYVAKFDHDGDGKPDFFNSYATSADILESGLTLDDDIDGDGDLDIHDTTPYYSSL